MKPFYTRILLLVLIAVIYGCASQKPYDGPVMKPKEVVKTFQPILDFMEYKPGMTFADVGAGSGVITIMMASLMDRSEVYIQDIDTAALSNKNISKVFDHYLKETNTDLRSKNKFHIVIGEVDATNLPDQTFDLIYSNGTVHNFTAFDAVMTDISRKLKPGGVVFFRDSFKGDHGEGDLCSDPKCGRPLITIDTFLSQMSKNGFVLVKRNADMSGYPVFGFKVASAP